MKKKIVWIIVIGILVLGAIGGGIYFYYYKQASADSKNSALDQLAYQKISALKIKYPDGNCQPKTLFGYSLWRGIRPGKGVITREYIKIHIIRQTGSKCKMFGGKCIVYTGDNDATQEYYDYYYRQIKGYYKQIDEPGKKIINDWDLIAFYPADIGVSVNLTCCQTSPTTTPTPSSSTSPTSTRTTTPSPSSTSSTGPTPSGH